MKNVIVFASCATILIFSIASFGCGKLAAPSSKVGITWTHVIPDGNFMPREQGAGLSYEGKLWLLGGDVANDPQNPTISNYTNEVLSTTTGVTWTTTIAAWTPRDSAAATVYLGKIFLFGGRTDGGYTNDLWSYSTSEGWIQGTSPADISDRGNASIGVYDSALWIIGGRDQSDNDLADVWKLENNIWVHESDLPVQSIGTVIFSDSSITVMGLTQEGEVYAGKTFSSTNGINWALVGYIPNFMSQFGIYRPLAIAENDGIPYLLGAGIKGQGGQPDQLFSKVYTSSDWLHWTTINASAEWPARGDGMFTPSYNGKIWVIGGENASGELLNDIWYSPSN